MGQDRQKTTVIALEDTICYLLKRDRIKELLESNPSFTEFFLQTHFTTYVDKVYREIHSKSLFFGSSDHLLFTTPVGEIVTKEVVTVREDATIRDAAQDMSKNRISCLIVMDRNELPVGIVTDRDLREKVVARGRNVDDPVEDIMTLPLIRVDVKDYCFEAAIKMIKHNVHHVLVIKEGKLKGVLTNHDLMLLQGSSPLSLLSFAKDLENQQTVEGLLPVSAKIDRVVGLLLKEGARASNITKIIAELHDQLVRKVLEIAEKRFGKPPLAYCWLAMGSEGRQEQIFKTDQDNAIIHADPATSGQEAAAKQYFPAFTAFVRDSLVQCGFPPCPDDAMASNPKWCQPLSVWKQYFSSWINMPSLAAVRRSRIFFDFRGIAGEHALADELRAFIGKSADRQNGFLVTMADAAVWNRPPLGLFRSLIVEKNGEHKNELDLKTSGIVPVVDLARLLSLEASAAETSTLERIEVVKDKILPQEHVNSEELAQAFEYINLLRIRHQAEQMATGEKQDNFINPRKLSNLERSMLRESFHIISRAQEAVADRYGIGLVRV
jgi:CBS domain-containing protein